MRRSFIVVFIVLCVSVMTLCASEICGHAGFSLLGLNGGIAVDGAENIRLGLDASAIMTSEAGESEGNHGVLVQGYIGCDVLPSISNDLLVKFTAAYMQFHFTDLSADSEYLKFAGFAFGIQYEHWFGKAMRHGIYVGLDFPLCGYCTDKIGNDYYEKGFFIGPLTSGASLGMALMSFRCGYGIHF